jgi:pyruvate,water dikinase
MKDIDLVGGKNASLGEIIQSLAKLCLKVPDGFATTTTAYKKFLNENNISRQIYIKLAGIDPHNLQDLKRISREIRQLIFKSKFNRDFIVAVTKKYQDLALNRRCSFAVRSLATTEDLSQASFAGQHESFLNVCGIKNILLAIKKVYASLFKERAIVYRIQNEFPHEKVAVFAGIQIMIRSDCGASGVMFTLRY